MGERMGKRVLMNVFFACSAFIGAIPLVLGESWIILTFLTRTFLLAQAALDIFDSVRW